MDGTGVILVMYSIPRNTNVTCFLTFVDVSFDSPVMCFICSFYRRQELTKKPCEGAFRITQQNNSGTFSFGPLTCLPTGAQFNKGGSYRMHHLDQNLPPIRNWLVTSVCAPVTPMGISRQDFHYWVRLTITLLLLWMRIALSSTFQTNQEE